MKLHYDLLWENKKYDEDCRKALWWLRTPETNESGRDSLGGPEYVLHVCRDGHINRREYPEWNDGVRPAVWIKEPDIDKS